MCGINGIISKNRAEDIARKLSTMNNSITHRGPDDDGLYVFSDNVGMAMRRLSIIDLSTGKQPMYNADNSICIVFNGEIYNYLELKAKQEEKGFVFKTKSDTEVVLSLYETLGEECLQVLNGMFSFSIHDAVKNRVFIARDRFGEKPLYYTSNNQYFLWASELKSIVTVFPELKVMNKDALQLYLSLTYIPAPHTIYQNIHKLNAGHYLTVDTKSCEASINEWWDVDITQGNGNQIDYNTAKQKLRSILFESVERRMIADVPLGVFLSGGVDSTIIAAIMAKISPKKIKTYTVGYTNKTYDESPRAKLVADYIGAEQEVFFLQQSDMLDRLDEVLLNYDEPFADSSALPTYFISSKAVKDVKVALTGDGGDEVFGGYNKYQSIRYRKMMQRWVPEFMRTKMTDPRVLEKYLGGRHTKSALSKAKRFLTSLEGDLQVNHLNIIALGLRQHELEQLMTHAAIDYKNILLSVLDKKKLSSLSDLKLLRYIDKEISLEGDMLVKVDRASMLCSLECRAPFLDHRLLELTYTWPDEFLIKGGNKKRILKETFSDLLPAGFFDAPKAGFEVPVGQWLRNELKEDLLQQLSPANVGKHDLFDTNHVQQLVSEHLSTRSDHSWKLWTLYCFQKWYLHNFN